MVLPMRRWRLNSGYNGATDQRRTQAGTIPMLKHYMERNLGAFSYSAGTTPNDVDVANLLLWYAADQEVAYSNGQSVSTMTNLTVGGSNATAFGTGPTYVTNILNSLPIYRFANNPCRTASSYSFTDFTFYLIFRNTSGADSFERLVDQDYQNGFWFGRSESTANTFGGGVREGSPPYGVFVNTATDGQWNIIANQRDGTVHNVWNNGDFANRASNSVVATATTTNVVGIGGWYNNNTQQAQNIDIAEIVFYNSALDSTERNLIEGYLAHKWGLQSNLPVGHPYKDVAP
jgi:hypothetical protein